MNYKKILRNNYIGCLTAIYDTNIFGKLYMPKIRKRQDWALWIMILQKSNKACGLQQVLATYMQRKNSISNNKSEMLNACKNGNLMATDLADWLVINYNVPFRKAYKMIAKIIGIANKKNCQINDLNISELNLIGNDSGKKIKKFLKIESSINYKKSLGSTSPTEVKKAIQNAKRELF